MFILECLERLQQPLLWVDADAVVMQKPTLELEGCDIALYFNDFETKDARNATIYLAPTERTKAFVKAWYALCLEKLTEENSIPYADQSVMISLLRSFPIRIAKLPLEYMVIFDRDQVPFEKIVILHFQASRTALMEPFMWENLSGAELKNLRLELSKKKYSVS